MSAFDFGKRRQNTSAQMVDHVPAGSAPAARRLKSIAMQRRRAASAAAALVPVIVLFASVVLCAASDREDCANAENTDQKIASCSRVIADDAESPKRAQAYSSRGAAYCEKGDLDRAIADFSEAVKIDPNVVPPYFILACSRRGLAAAERKDYDQAIADYSEAIKFNPTAIISPPSSCSRTSGHIER